MTAERWLKVVELFNSALEREPGRRADFLDEACAGDESLRREIDSLLASHEPDGSFLESPAFEVAARELAGAQDASESGYITTFERELPPTTQPTSKSPFFWFVVIAGALVLGCYVFSGLMIFRYGTLTKEFGWESLPRKGAWYISKVDTDGAATSKLQAGDKILAINGDTRISRAGPYSTRWAMAPESSYTIRVERDSAQQQYQLSVPLNRDYRNFEHIFSLLPVSIAFYVLAMLVGIYKPEERTAQLGCVASFAMALIMLAYALAPIGVFFQGSELTAYFLIGLVYPMHLALGYHFYYRFPPGVAKGRFWSVLKYVLYACCAIIAVAFTSIRLVASQGEQVAIPFFFNYGHYVRALNGLYGILLLIAFGAECAVIIRNYRRVQEPDQRRRIKWLIYGSIAGLLPLLLLSLARFALAISRSGYVIPESRLANLATVIVPITLGYAILRHRVLDINVVIRRGLQYLLAKNVLRIILALPVTGLVLTVVSDPNRTLKEILFRNSIYFYLLLIVAAATSLLFRRRLREWIDKKFFRERYDQEKILRELIDDIKKLDSMSEITQRVSVQVERALHPEHLYLFYREEEKRDLSLGYSSGGISQELRIPEEFRLLHFMEDLGGAQDFPFPHRNNLPQSEKNWLAGLGVNLIVPMSGTDGHLSGLFLLGEKKSEVSYTTRDREMLETLAAQMAIVFENVRLKKRVAKDRKIRHEVLNRFAGQNINLLKECPTCGACFNSSSLVCAKDQHELTLSLPVERTIEGRYRLDQLLGKGGMGAVYEARDLRLSRQVAVKILSGSLFGDSGALRRFEREAQTAARLNHQNIITVHDYGVLNTEGAYLVMELAQGETLGAVIKRERQLHPRTASEWVNQVLEGVKAAHRVGIVHRDLKPENILISKGEKGQTLVRILDFGLAKVMQQAVVDTHSPTATVTTPGTVLGTFGYMSPEQLTGGEVDERSDLFSIGVMAVEALTGRRPFGGKTLPELMASVLHGSFQLEGESKESRRLNEVLQKSLARNRAERFTSAAEMQKELVPALRNCPTSLARESPSGDVVTLTD